jgi:hypothetical protein
MPWISVLKYYVENIADNLYALMMGACRLVLGSCQIVGEIVNAVVAVIDGSDAAKIRAAGKSCRQLNREVGDSLKAPCDNVRWKRQRLHFRKEHDRARRLRVQGEIL